MNEDFKLFLDDLLVYLEAQEAGIVQLRMQIKKLQGCDKPNVELPFDASRIKWQDKQNVKGKFQMSEELDNPEHDKLVKYLNGHADKCAVSGDYFYWLYENGCNVGRKLRKKA